VPARTLTACRDRGTTFIADHHFDPSIQLPPTRVGVIGDRETLAVTLTPNSRRIDAPRDERGFHGVGARLRKSLVIGFRTDAIGEAVDLDAALRMLGEELRQLIELARGPGFNCALPVSNSTSPSVSTSPRGVGFALS